MKNSELKKFIDAVDVVCIYCICCSPKKCAKCPVRKSVDYYHSQEK